MIWFLVQFFRNFSFLFIGTRHILYRLSLIILVLTHFARASCTGVSFDCCAINACPDGGAVDAGCRWLYQCFCCCRGPKEDAYDKTATDDAITTQPTSTGHEGALASTSQTLSLTQVHVNVDVHLNGVGLQSIQQIPPQQTLVYQTTAKQPGTLPKPTTTETKDHKNSCVDSLVSDALGQPILVNSKQTESEQIELKKAKLKPAEPDQAESKTIPPQPKPLTVNGTINALKTMDSAVFKSDRNHLTTSQCRSIAAQLEGNSQLRMLFLLGKDSPSISRSNLDVIALASALPLNQRLRCLNLSGNNILGEGITYLSAALVEDKAAGNRFNKTLVILNLSNCNLHEGHVTHVKKIIECNRSIKLIDISDNCNFTDNLSRLKQEIEHGSNPTLLSLILHDTRVKQQDISTISRCLYGRQRDSDFEQIYDEYIRLKMDVS